MSSVSWSRGTSKIHDDSTTIVPTFWSDGRSAFASCRRCRGRDLGTIVTGSELSRWPSSTRNNSTVVSMFPGTKRWNLSLSRWICNWSFFAIRLHLRTRSSSSTDTGRTFTGDKSASKLAGWSTPTVSTGDVAACVVVVCDGAHFRCHSFLQTANCIIEI